MKTHTITGAGNTRLHVVENGNTAGRAILFIHGFSQCSLAWTRQLDSDLAEKHRLVAMDLRGHGRSDKPRDGYADSKLWADDVRAVIDTVGLSRPILCGWSYGPLVILDYVRHYGEDAISGMNFIGGITKLGDEDAVSVLTNEFLALVPGFFSSDVEESVGSLAGLLDLCFAEPLQVEAKYQMLGSSVSVPPYVRQGLLSRTFDNHDLLPRIRTPVLITHGSADRVVKPAVIDRQMVHIPTATTRTMATGHACFWDDAPGYNRSLAQFAETLA